MFHSRLHQNWKLSCPSRYHQKIKTAYRKSWTRIFPKYVKKQNKTSFHFFYLCVNIASNEYSTYKRKMGGPLELELQAVVSWMTWALRNQTWVLWKSSKGSKMLTHLSRPLIFFFLHLFNLVWKGQPYNMASMGRSKDLWESVFLFYHVSSWIEFRSLPVWQQMALPAEPSRWPESIFKTNKQTNKQNTYNSLMKRHKKR